MPYITYKTHFWLKWHNISKILLNTNRISTFGGVTLFHIIDKMQIDFSGKRFLINTNLYELWIKWAFLICIVTGIKFKNNSIKVPKKKIFFHFSYKIFFKSPNFATNEGHCIWRKLFENKIPQCEYSEVLGKCNMYLYCTIFKMF